MNKFDATGFAITDVPNNAVILYVVSRSVELAGCMIEYKYYNGVNNIRLIPITTNIAENTTATVRVFYYMP